MKNFQIFCFGLAALFCSSCAYFNPPLSSAARGDNKSAILYGRFHLTQDNDDGFRLGLWLQNVKTKEPVYLQFFATNSVYAVSVEPGAYQIQGFIAIDREHEIKGRGHFPESKLPAWLGKPFPAEAGASLYLGDFTGRVIFDGMIVEWKMDTVAENFLGTTGDYHKKYAGLPASTPASIFVLNFNRQ